MKGKRLERPNLTLDDIYRLRADMEGMFKVCNLRPPTEECCYLESECVELWDLICDNYPPHSEATARIEELTEFLKSRIGG